MILNRREAAAGVQLSEEFAQITWFDSSVKEPQTCGLGEGEEPELIPLPKDLSGKLFGADTDFAEEEQGSLAAFFRTVLSRIPGEPVMEDLRVMVTLPRLREGVEVWIPSALQALGIARKNIYLQDYLSSFYYYSVNQKKELWSGDVALLEYEKPQMVGYILHIDRTKTPALATVKRAASVTVDEKLFAGNDKDWQNREKDRLLFELLKKTFERRNVTTSYLVGEYYDGSWAIRSFQYLCQHRHAFRGGNLYTKGACYAAMSRAGMIRPVDILFLGEDMIRENMGMTMRIGGKETYYPIVTAGLNWYEVHHECAFIPDQETSLTLVTKPMDGGEEVSHILRLGHFPDRPNRATRLRMNVYFLSSVCCRIEVEDLGFGGFFAPEGKKWSRTIRFEKAAEEMH